MVLLYVGSGSHEVDLVERIATFLDWKGARRSAERMLRARKEEDAAAIISNVPFELWSGTNFFNDEFILLYVEVSPEEYVNYDRWSKDPSYRRHFKEIAEALASVGTHIRFVAIGVALEPELYGVPQPTPQASTESVERALRDAEHLLKASGPSSAVDRIHTAFHAYLRAVVSGAGIGDTDANVTHLFKVIRTKHPAVQGPVSSRILGGMASIVDTINTARNHSSLAHPNEELLDEPDAMLVIHAVRTMLHYLDSRLHTTEGAPNPGLSADA